MGLYLDLSDSGGPNLARMYIGRAVRLCYSVGRPFLSLMGLPLNI